MAKYFALSTLLLCMYVYVTMAPLVLYAARICTYIVQACSKIHIEIQWRSLKGRDTRASHPFRSMLPVCE
jgi:hypothetical protein